MSANRLECNPNSIKKNVLEYGESKPIVVVPDTSLIGAIALMNRHRSSYLLIESRHKLIGIFTERDLVKLIASDLNFAGKTVGDVMTKQPIVLSIQNQLSPTELTSIFGQHQIRHLPLLDPDGKTVGVITHNSLRKSIHGNYFLRQKKVAEAMNCLVVTATGDRNLAEIAKLMVTHGVSCIVIVSEEREKLLPLGIVTERDLVQFKALDLDLYHLPIRQVMSSPLLHVSKEAYLQDAHDMMFKHHIRRLVVTDRNGCLVGIIIQSDILKSLDIYEVYRVLEFLEDLVEKRTKQLKAEREIEINRREKFQQNERYFQTILANIDEIVLLVKPDSLEASVFSDNLDHDDYTAGYGDRHKDSLTKKILAQFDCQETSQIFFAASQKALATKQKVDFEYAITLPDTEKQYFAAQIYPLSDDSTIWIAKNITRSQTSKPNCQPEKLTYCNYELETANKLLQQQISQILGFASPLNSYRQNSWLQHLLPVDNKLGNLLRQIQSYNYPLWTGAIVTLAIAFIVESYRRAGIIIPVPFMFLIISVSASASLGGVLAGLWSHLVWSSFVMYAAIVGFGPKTLTGGIVEITAGIVVMGIFAVVLGWSKEQNHWLTGILKSQNHRLHQEIAFRTKDLATINANLKTEIQERTAIQQALADSEQKFRTIFEQAEVGIVVASLNKKLLQVNPKFCRFVGYSAEQLKTMTFAQITHPDEILSDSHHVAKMKTNQFDTLTREKRYIHQDGRIIWGNLTATVVKNAWGKPDYFIAIIQDITKRKQAELALEESEMRFQSLLNSCPFLIWISGLNGLCNFFNTSWLDFTGRTMEQELGTGWCEGVHPEDLDFCLNIYTSAFERRERFKMEYRLRQRNGEYAWILDEGRPRFKADGSFAGYIGTCVDISDRMKAAQERERLLQKIERERQFLESVLQQMPAGVLIAEAPSGRILLKNNNVGHILGREIPKITRIEDYANFGCTYPNSKFEGTQDCPMVRALKGETIEGVEVQYFYNNGTKGTLFVNAAPILDRKSNIIAAVETFYDITELKQAQAAKKDAENKSILLKEIHHRIKNNLQIVSALLDLQSEQIQDKNAIALLEKSQTRIHTMALIHEKLYSSKNLKQIDFVEYVFALTRYLCDSLIRDPQQIKLALDIEPTQLSLDLATPCGLIINELVVNSLEHGFVNRATGEIQIRFGRNCDRSYYLIVKDDGWGISQAIDIINDTRFLGLSLVSSLVEKQLKGSWKIHQNKGCVIKITFPCT